MKAAKEAVINGDLDKVKQLVTNYCDEGRGRDPRGFWKKKPLSPTRSTGIYQHLLFKFCSITLIRL